MAGRFKSEELPNEILLDILNGLDECVCVTDPQTDEILYANRPMENLFGPDGAKLAGKTCWQEMHAAKTERCEFCPKSQLANRPDTTIRWIHTDWIEGKCFQKTDRLIDWVDGQKAHLQIAVDVTEQVDAKKEMELQLQQQKLLRGISHDFLSSEAIEPLVETALEKAGRFLNVSKMIVSQVDAQEGSFCRRFAWVDKEGGARLGKKVKVPFAPGSPVYETFVSNKEPYVACGDIGKPSAFSYLAQFGVKAYIAVPIYVDGKFWGMMLVDDCQGPREWSPREIHLVSLLSSLISDLIIREETEKDLVVMSSIVDSSPQCAAYLDNDANVRYANRGAEAILGYEPSELLGKNLYNLVNPQIAGWIRREVKPSIVREDGNTFEIPLLHKDGHEVYLLVTVFRIGEHTEGLGLIAQDISDKKKLEDALVREKDRAEEANRAKSEFLARMSHEMRTPMNAIIGMTSIAQNADDIERKDYCLDKIETASSHLLGVINDVLDMSKIEAGRFELSPAEFNLEKMLLKLANVMGYRIEEKKQRFDIHVEPDVPVLVETDEQRLMQVLTNLLSNAVKFTPEGGQIALSVRCNEEEDGLLTLGFEMRDTGIGISPEQQKKLFQSFEQADGSISRRFGGTGLGLAISKKIVELMDGEITVESVQGEGAAFRFSIRVKRGEKGLRGLLHESVNWEDLHTLVVDDDEVARECFSNIAKSLRVHCDVAQSGPEAFEMMEKQDEQYHIIFVDWKMPGMDGVEVASRIKEKYGENTVVIMVSAAEWNDVRAAAVDAGVQGYIPKPLFASTVADCIHECLGALGEPDDAEGEFIEGEFAGRRLLLAEDVEINREILQVMLEPTGVTIDCAENGLEAVEMFSAGPEKYDMVFMDIHMPEVDGFEATKRIRQLDNQWARKVPIVAMTANVFREDIQACLDAGMNAHVGKPLDIEDVHQKLKKYLLWR